MKLFLLFSSLMTMNWASHADCLKVYLLAGQSNAVGMGKVNEIPASYQDIKAVNEYKLTWNYVTQTLEPLKLGENNNLLHTWKENFGPEGMLGFELLQNQNEPFIIFKYAYSGSSLYQDWNSRIAGSFYYQMLSELKRMENALQSMGKSVCYEAMFWSQGGADTGPHDVDDYAQNLENFIHDLRLALHSEKLPFITCRLNHEKDEDRFHRQQDKVAKKVSAYKIVETSDLPQDADSIHFNAEGQIGLGQRFYEAYTHLKMELEQGSPTPEVVAYPIPFATSMNELTVKIENNFYCQKAKLEMIDMLGRQVYESQKVDISSEGQTKIGISGSELISLASAPYILSVTLDECLVVMKENDKQLIKKIIIF